MRRSTRGLGRIWLRWRVALTLVGVAFLSAGPPSFAGPAQEYPTETGEALRYYEGQVDSWLAGPAEYMILDDEREQWNDLETTEQRESFIEWFWARRNADPRAREHEFKLEFYERVATSNQRFRGFPRGWKSDRGRVWITLGPPDSIGRRTSAQLFNVNGPDFTVWTYYTAGRSRGFSTNFGEFYVLFIETRPGQPEIYDPRFGTGSWPIDLRRAFEYENESHVVDPNLEFDPDTPDARYVREVSDAELPLTVPTEELGAERGVAGIALLPVRLRLGDLLFQGRDGRFVSRVDVEATLVPEGGGDAHATRREWSVVLEEDELVALGTESLTAALSAPVGAGTYDVRIGVAQPLAGSRNIWSGRIEVEAGGADASRPLIGSKTIVLDPEADATVAVIAPSYATLEPGAEIVVVTWVRGPTPDPERVRLLLTGPRGDEQRLEVLESRWRGSAVGPLVIATRLPDLEEGDYDLRVELDGLRSEPAELQISRY